MERVVYETGIEQSDVLGSCSSYFNVVTTTDEAEAFREYRRGNRNYLYKRTYATGKPLKREWWCDWEKCWSEW